jgi:uncharacterized membrane protein
MVNSMEPLVCAVWAIAGSGAKRQPNQSAATTKDIGDRIRLFIALSLHNTD